MIRSYGAAEGHGHSTSARQGVPQESDTLDDLAYQAPNGLKTISDKLGLKIQHTGWITQQGGGSGLGQYAAVRKAAFSDAVLKDQLNSKVLDLGDQRHVVLRVVDHQKAQRKPLAEVRDTIHNASSPRRPSSVPRRRPSRPWRRRVREARWRRSNSR